MYTFDSIRICFQLDLRSVDGGKSKFSEGAGEFHIFKYADSVIITTYICTMRPFFTYKLIHLVEI